MKKILYFLSIILFSSFLFSEKYQFVCIDFENNFQQVFDIDEYKQTIHRSYSIDLENNQNFQGEDYSYPDLIWDTTTKIVGRFHRNNSNSSFQWFDLKNNRLISRTYYPDGWSDELDDDWIWNQYYKCHKIY